jgi:hypothetical protein
MAQPQMAGITFSEPDSFKIQLGTSKEEWANLSVQLRNRLQARFDPEELNAIDRFILLAKHLKAGPGVGPFSNEPGRSEATAR